MELQQIRYFLALARLLNFTRAAEQCNVTQPALTRAIQKLELELGGILIHREHQLTQLSDLENSFSLCSSEPMRRLNRCARPQRSFNTEKSHRLKSRSPHVSAHQFSKRPWWR